MGLDITAYRLVRLPTAEELAEVPVGEEPENWWYRHHPDGPWLRTFFSEFPATADSLDDKRPRLCFEREDFRAGSYSGYNFWRAELARMLDTTAEAIWADPVPGPFVELINNSDAESVIGPVTSKKLAKDFADYAEKAAEHADHQGYPDWLRLYDRWAAAFRWASGEGCVDFH